MTESWLFRVINTAQHKVFKAQCLLTFAAAGSPQQCWMPQLSQPELRLHHQWPPKESLCKSLAQNQLIKPVARRGTTQFSGQHSQDYLPHSPHFTVFLFLQQVNTPYLHTQAPSLHIPGASLGNKKLIQAVNSSMRLCCCWSEYHHKYTQKLQIDKCSYKH